MNLDDKPTDTPRFEFGRNWDDFLKSITPQHLDEAARSLRRLLDLDDLEGQRFLDIGSGSGLFSLSAIRMGAEVVSFDYDRHSVECAIKLKGEYFPRSAHWTILQGSILSRKFIESLGKFDICYAWGVLHHTGSLWQALFNAQIPVKVGGRLVVAIYNDEGIVSSAWAIIKRCYCRGGIHRALLSFAFYPIFLLSGLAADLVRFKNPAARYVDHKRKHRGMSLVHDWKDWLGGYPYEVATPARVEAFLRNCGFELLKTIEPAYGFGNNQFVFRRVG